MQMCFLFYPLTEVRMVAATIGFSRIAANIKSTTASNGHNRRYWSLPEKGTSSRYVYDDMF